jgi:hypothetical protein
MRMLPATLFLALALFACSERKEIKAGVRSGDAGRG